MFSDGLYDDIYCGVLRIVKLMQKLQRSHLFIVFFLFSMQNSNRIWYHKHLNSWLLINVVLHFRGKYPFGDYISYSNLSFTLKEVKHLWRQNGCLTKYGRHLVMRIDDFQKPARTNVLCSNWKEWDQPIIW